MKTVTNKTRKPLSVPLPRGGVLHLGPGRTGQITAEAAETAVLRKLVDAGELAVSEGVASAGGGGGGRKGPPGFHGHAAGGAGRRGGDR